MADATYYRDQLSPQDYYASLDGHRGSAWPLKDKFHDIDDKIHFKPYMKRLSDPLTKNFVLDFGNEDAYCATDLEEDEIQLLLRKPRAKCFGTRWINFWTPEEQKASIKAITTHYGVSERLQGMMCTDPAIHRPQPVVLPNKRQSRSRSRDFDSTIDELDDVESAIYLKNLPEQDAMHDAPSFKHLTFAHVTNQIWHFSSVDHGPRLPDVPKKDMDNGEDLPDGRRIWNWLILTDDGTIISIQENPLPMQQGPLSTSQTKILDVVRRNIKFIFSGVSKQHLTMSENDSLVTIRVRHFSDSGPDEANIKQEEGPSLLFYYIFDDWVSSYGLIAKREHKYGVALERLRADMLNRPVVELINELHWLGRRLAVLKRLYQSYELIMQRLLQRHRMLRDEARSHQPAPLPFGATFGDKEFADLRKDSLMSSGSFPSTSDKPVGVILSSAAAARFERLADRIVLYCLSEIESCLTEKESLTFLNFNLIALKDSQAVEKLTRITILLAKATILFLPVSLMTAYFSTELQGVKGGYTKVDYWTSFAVIFVVSIVLLMLFGKASDTVEGKTIYRSLVKTFFRSGRERAARISGLGRGREH
ncbi:uncharacterized protein N7443_001137 [Penicillium atrosanguineum]|uniref:Uncharacterized protein n=1 Tax=Penicillium atrosanguineum TaxID=1132637 RepID=A0A9W9QEC9_9EURO|nr:uncharacterized protein N7443_001137 [Penicillium atrosanguineum]KAJ5147270.1 hypothetical protein N7526_000622 [Penicillium atrosanguineum]KAJ5314253.1 hypothetical protein N7443_001137 [Penicillium atrosanguineum]KAJ5331419.1 hypothetical protein N7476_001202 [Penicillium atrosanguineum]